MTEMSTHGHGTLIHVRENKSKQWAKILGKSQLYLFFYAPKHSKCLDNSSIMHGDALLLESI